LAEATGLVADLSTCWVGQSGGKITGITINDSRAYHSSALSRCNLTSIWNEGASKFQSGRNGGYYANHASRHLLVISEGATCGAGVATVGDGGGGLILM